MITKAEHTCKMHLMFWLTSYLDDQASVSHWFIPKKRKASAEKMTTIVDNIFNKFPYKNWENDTRELEKMFYLQIIGNNG